MANCSGKKTCGKGSKLTPQARKYLADRGIDEKAAKARGLCSLVAAETKKQYGKSVQSLNIPYYTASGEVLVNDHAAFNRVRTFPRGLLTNAKKFPRFLQKKGTKNHLYLDPGRKNWVKIQKDSSVTVTITEGEIKSICANIYGIPCIGVGGVSGWKTRINGQSIPLPELDEWEWKGRKVELAFDADVMTKPDVQAALSAFAQELGRRGAEIKSVSIPALEGQGNTGIDDFLVANGREAYDALPREDVKLILDPKAPLDIARVLVAARYTEGELRTLHNYQDVFYAWDGTCYCEVPMKEIKKQVYELLDSAKQKTTNKEGKGITTPIKPSRNLVDNVCHALESWTHVKSDLSPPFWLNGREVPEVRNTVVCRNGLLHIPRKILYEHSPAFFGLSALSFDFNPDAPKPEQWLAFLGQLWHEDPSAINTLQEVFGYLLTTDTSQHKIFMLVGPKRSGKGTIARVLTELLGCDNVCSPTLDSLSTNFGLSGLIGKQLAIVGDARLSRKSDQQQLSERLLSISGEDHQTIDRKFREHWNGKLSVRFLILTNEIPKILDASGALPSRFIMLQLVESFYGKEDPKLTDKLLPELPGILNWAIDGWKRLQKRGHFCMPKSSANTIQEMEDLASPVGAFVRDYCVVESGAKIPTEDLYEGYGRFCKEHEYKRPLGGASFGRDLRAVVPTVQRKNLRCNGKQTRTYTGIRLKEEHEMRDHYNEKLKKLVVRSKGYKWGKNDAASAAGST